VQSRKRLNAAAQPAGQKRLKRTGFVAADVQSRKRLNAVVQPAGRKRLNRTGFGTAVQPRTRLSAAVQPRKKLNMVGFVAAAAVQPAGSKRLIAAAVHPVGLMNDVAGFVVAAAVAASKRSNVAAAQLVGLDGAGFVVAAVPPVVWSAGDFGAAVVQALYSNAIGTAVLQAY
jgi:hypothetical protein